MAKVSEKQLRQYENFKSKVSVFNHSKNDPKPKIRYGVYVDRVQSGYRKNGVWYSNVK